MFEKTDEQKTFLTDTMASNKLMKLLSPCACTPSFITCATVLHGWPAGLAPMLQPLTSIRADACARRDVADRDTLLMAFQTKHFPIGSEIIKQGDEGDMFYVLYSGECDISITGKGSVMKATKARPPTAPHCSLLAPSTRFVLSRLQLRNAPLSLKPCTPVW